MKIKPLMTAVCLFSLYAVAEDSYNKKFESVQPTKCDNLYLKRVKAFKNWNKTAPKGGLVLLGDSITQGFPEKQAPKEWKLSARGIAGDGVGGGKFRGLINRLDVSCNNLAPSKVFIKIGINDIRNSDEEQVRIPLKTRLDSYREIIRSLKKNNKTIEIYLSSILPTRGKYAFRNKEVREVNTLLKQLAEKEKINYFDLGKAFLVNGEMNPELTKDDIHLNAKGYKVWIRELHKIMK